MISSIIVQWVECSAKTEESCLNSTQGGPYCALNTLHEELEWFISLLLKHIL